jgi:cytochrome c553
MIGKALPLAVVASAFLLASAIAAGVAIELKSVDVSLPESSRQLPHAPAAASVCVACHSAGMILNQPPLARAAWEAEVEKMRNAYKAPIDPKDVAKIVDYLTEIRGAK